MRPEVGFSPCTSFLNSNRDLAKPCNRHLSCVVHVSKRPDNSHPSDGIDEAAYKELSPGAREVFKEVITCFDSISSYCRRPTGQHLCNIINTIPFASLSHFCRPRRIY